MTRSSEKYYKKLFEKLEDPDFQNETSLFEKEFEYIKTKNNLEKMKKVKGLVHISNQFKYNR